MCGSWSFYHQTLVRKTLIPTKLWLFYDFISLQNNVNVASKNKKQEQLEEKKFLVAIFELPAMLRIRTCD
jgi:hypothetical protein